MTAPTIATSRREQARDDLLLLIAACLVRLSFQAVPDSGRQAAELDRIRAILDAEAQR